MTSYEDENYFRSTVDLMLDETLEGVSLSTKLFMLRPTRKNTERMAGASLAHLRALGLAIDQIFAREYDLSERLAMINSFAAAAEQERVRIINEAAGFELCEALPLAYYLTDDNELVLSDDEEGPDRPIDVLSEVDTDDFSEDELCKLIKEQILGAYQGNIAGDLINLRLFKASRGLGRILFWGEKIGDHSGDMAKILAGGIAGYALAKTLIRENRLD